MTEAENGEQFSLRWNNFHANLSSGFTSLLQEEDLVDVTIAVDGRFVQAHKVVLSICSPYFKQLFKINPCKHPIVILKDVSYWEMTGLLQFMYRGEVSIGQDQLPDFLRAAELLHVKGLTGSESESPKAEKKFAKFEPSKQRSSATPLKKKRSSLDATESSVGAANRAGVAPDFVQSGRDESAPSASNSFDLVAPKIEPPDLAEAAEPDRVGGDAVNNAFQHEIEPTSYRQENVKNVSARFACPECGKSFTRRDNLSTHVSDIHGEGRGPLRCPICPRTAKNRTSLRTHLYNIHHLQYSSVLRQRQPPTNNNNNNNNCEVA